MQISAQTRRWMARGVVFVVLLVAVFGALAPALHAETPAPAPAATPNPPPGHTTGGEDDGDSTVARILTSATLGIIGLLGKILTVLVSGVIWVSEYNDFINSLAVVNGWVIVRDVANMFFIIVLLVIAFGTILGQEEYHYKKLLPKLLILAVLVNFSRTIVGVMIDFSQVIMLTFVNGYKAAAGGNFSNIFQIVELLQLPRAGCPSPTNPSGTPDDWGVFSAALLGLIMVVVSITTMAVILAVLVLRVITLWLLTILSPLAFLMGTFPQGQKYYAQWWEELKNNIMVGPMLAFFLWLSLVTVGSGNAAAQMTSGGRALVTPEGEIQVACSAVGNTESIISFIIGTMMLLAGVQMAQQMGGAIAGIASQARGAATRALKFGAKALAAPVAFGAGLGAKKAQRHILDYAMAKGAGPLRKSLAYMVAPGRMFGAVLKRGDVLREESLKIAEAQAEEDSHAFFTGGKRRLPLRAAAEHAITAQYAKDFSFLPKEEVMQIAAKAGGLGGVEGGRLRAAIGSTGGHAGFLDDIARLPVFRQKLVELGRRKYGYQRGTFYNKALLNDQLWDWYTGEEVGSGKGIAKARKNPEQYQYAGRMIAALGEVGKQNGHWEYIGHSVFDPSRNLYVPQGAQVDAQGRAVRDAQGRLQGDHAFMHEARQELNKRPDRERAGVAPQVDLALRETGPGLEDADWYGDIDTPEESMREVVTPALARESRGVQGRHFEALFGAKLRRDVDAQGRDRVTIIGNQVMADFARDLNDQDSDFVFSLYARRAGLTDPKEAYKQGSFDIEFVDAQGNVATRTIRRPAPRGGGAPPGAPGAPAAPPGAPPTPPPAAPPSPPPPPPPPAAPPPPPPVQQAIRGSAVIQTTIKPALSAAMGGMGAGFVQNQPLFRAMRKLIKDLNSEISGLEKKVGVGFGELSKKLGKLDSALPREDASADEIRAGLSAAGVSEDDVRRDISDILGDISR